MIRHYQAKIKFNLTGYVIEQVDTHKPDEAAANIIQYYMYDEQGLDGYFHVVHAKVKNNKLKAYVIFQIDDEDEESCDGFIKPIDDLKECFKLSYGDEAKMKIKPIHSFNIAK